MVYFLMKEGPPPIESQINLIGPNLWWIKAIAWIHWLQFCGAFLTKLKPWKLT